MISYPIFFFVSYRFNVAFLLGNGLIDVKYMTLKLNMSSTNKTANLYTLKALHLGNYLGTASWVTGINTALHRLLKIIIDCSAQNSKQKVIRALENISACIIEKFADQISLNDIHYSRLSLKNIKMDSLTNLHIRGDFLLLYNEKSMIINGEISVQNIKIHADYKAFTGISWIYGKYNLIISFRCFVYMFHYKVRILLYLYKW